MENVFELKLSDNEINAISTLGLAHVGDAVYELMVRTWLCTHGKATSRGLHAATVAIVNAPSQAAAVEKIMPELSEQEAAVYRRGRNTRVNSVPHRSTINEYHAATGLEALVGWLYLRGERERLCKLFSIIMEEKDNAS